MKVHLMAMKSGCKIYTHKCYVTANGPFSNIECVAHNVCNVPS